MNPPQRRPPPGQPPLHADRDRINRQPCPYCHAPAGQTCTNPLTGDELEHLTAHQARTRLSEKPAT